MPKPFKKESEYPGIESVKNLLGNKDFVKFLDSYDGGDDIDPSTPEGAQELQTRFERFEIGKRAIPEIKNLFREQIARDLDVKLADSEMPEVGEYIERMVRENPESVQELMCQIDEFRTHSESIARKEQEIEELLEAHGGKGGVDFKARHLDEARNKGAQRIPLVGHFLKPGSAAQRIPLVGRFLRPDGRQERSRSTLERDHGIKGDYDRELEKVREVQADIARLEEYQEIRAKIFGDIDVTRAVFEKARQKAQDKLKQLADPKKGIKEWEQALDYQQHLRKAGEHGPVDYLEGYERQVGEGEGVRTINAEEQEETIKVVIDKKTTEIIRDALRNHQTFPEFNRAMENLVKKERIGARTGKEKQAFIRRTLEDQLEGAPFSKRLFIKTFLATFEQGA